MSHIFPSANMTIRNSVESELADELRSIGARVEALPDEQVVRPELEAALADQLTDHFTHEPMVLGDARTESNTEQIQIQEQNPRYFGPGGQRSRRKLDVFLVRLPLISGSTQWFPFRPNVALPPLSDDVTYDPGRRAIVIRVVNDPRDDPNGSLARAFVREEEAKIRGYMGALNQQLAAWNEQLPEVCRRRVAQERDLRLARDQRLRTLGPPVAEGGASVPYPLPRKRAPRVRLDPVELHRLGGRPVLPLEDLHAVLNELQRAALFFAEHPSTKDQGEDALRDLVLAILNAAFPAGATGESFSKKGKTDIRVMTTPAALSGSGDCVFKAECKIWDGPKTASDAFDQLADRYLTALEVRAAIVLFVRPPAMPSDASTAALADLVLRYGATRKDPIAGWPIVRISHPNVPHPVDLAVMAM